MTQHVEPGYLPGALAMTSMMMINNVTCVAAASHLITELKVLAGMAPVVCGGVRVGQPHKAL